jgi:superfamily II DNA or RNA helicase
MERLGGRFGLIVFDEVHHLPGDLYRQAAEQTIAPFRLGLTATLERDDGRHRELDDLVGPVVFRRGIKDLAGHILAEYRTETIEVEMTPADRSAYDAARGHYRGFVESQGIRVGSRGGWRRFLAATSRSEEGRAALAAYHRQKQLALAHDAKIERLGDLLAEHWADRTIVFANDNDTVYRISERFLCPTITHQTPLSERTEVLQRFAEGTYRVVVTSKVLNEGVDVPAANVAVVLSGTGSVREHVQRLGRILRREEGKQAILYELVTAESVEAHQSKRRRDHDAYR